jgi:glycine dehydrogenase subunit 1
VHAVPKRLLVTAFSEPLAYGLLKSPGACGADIACGEGQSFGNAPSFGGPGLGMFAARQPYMRNMPGRLIGKTVDREGRSGFVLTLATREQHIRRERATSNICSNQGLCATAAVMYMASLGGTGIRRLAHLNRDRTEYLKKGLAEAGIDIPFASPTFNEFVARFPAGFSDRHARLQEKADRCRPAHGALVPGTGKPLPVLCHRNGGPAGSGHPHRGGDEMKPSIAESAQPPV